MAKVDTPIVPDGAQSTLQAIIRGKGRLDSVIDSDGFACDDGWGDGGDDTPCRVDHGNNAEFACGHRHQSCLNDRCHECGG